MRLDRRGFSLLELIVAVAIAMIMGTVAVVSYGKIAVSRLERKTVERLNDLAGALVAYWDLTGQLPPRLEDASSLSGIPPADAWGNAVAYYRDVVESGTGVRCSALLISGGADGNVDSSVYQGTASVSGRDIWRCVTPYEFEETNRARTALSLQRAKAALSLYLQTVQNPSSACTTQGSATCTSVLVGSGYLEGTAAYDAWGRPFVVYGGSLRSAGPDGAVGTADDVV